MRIASSKAWEVVVCSGFEAFKNILGTPSRGEHENRDELSGQSKL